ncbi:MAG: flagellar export chaperone FlgN [Planctomycetota bacterium]
MQQQLPVGDPSVRDLEAVVIELIGAYQELETLGQEQHEAMRYAQPAVIAECVRRQNEVVQRITKGEQRRASVVASLAERIGAEEKSATRITRIAASCAADDQERLQQAAETLKESIARVTKLNEVSRRSAESLAKHMQGLWGQIGAELSHAGTYSSAGAVAKGTAVMSSLDARG